MDTAVLPRALDESFGFNLDRTATLVRRELLRVLAPEGLLPEHWQVLVVLGENGPLSQQQLADVLRTDKHAMSRTLARMERSGWIRRAPSPGDSRVRVVHLARKAAARLVPMRNAVRGRFRQRLAPLAGADTDRLIHLLRHVRAILEDTP
jgi:DNA-binding MarR family transcriptional regulator